MPGLDKLSFFEISIIGFVLEGFLYGFYFAIFSMYIQHQASKELGMDKRNVLLHALCILFVLSTATVVLDIVCTATALSVRPKSLLILPRLAEVLFALVGLCDFISQAILIYRCWIVWDRNIYVIIIPSILALTFLATWMVIEVHGLNNLKMAPEPLTPTHLGFKMGTTSFSISLAVNAVVTGLIVIKILKVYLKVGGNNLKLRSIAFIIIESGMAMFSIQLIQLVFTTLELDATYTILGIYNMFNGITPTIILLRVSMKLSFYDEKSMEEAVGNLSLGSCHDHPCSETGDIDSISIVGQVQETLDHIDIQQG